jgi:hypothetical protein
VVHGVQCAALGQALRAYRQAREDLVIDGILTADPCKNCNIATCKTDFPATPGGFTLHRLLLAGFMRYVDKGVSCMAALGRGTGIVLIAFAAVSACSIQDVPAPRAAEMAHPLPISGVASLDLVLQPEPDSIDTQRIGAIDIALTFSRLEVPAGTPMFRLALVADNVDTDATTLRNLSVMDRDGPVPVHSRDVELSVEDARDSEAGGKTREWFSDRAISGPVIVRYEVPGRATLPPRGPTGPLAFRDDEGGVSGAGNIFLVTPPGDDRYNARVSWDLSALGKGARGVSSLGEGSVSSPQPMSSSELRMSYFMSGRIGIWSDPDSKDFFSAWQGTPPFDAEALMTWTSKLHHHYKAFFGQVEPGRYGVFLRYNPVNAGGGTGFFRSFVTTYGAGKGSDINEIKITLAHEMFHTFSPYIVDPPGKESSWFGEGLAVFYESALPFRFGMLTPQRFVDVINTAASRYYSSIMATLPNGEIAGRFWKDTRVRTLAYDRGMLYFVTVDETVRQRSGGTKSLDDLVLGMLHQEQQGRKLSNAHWEAMLRQYLGETGVADFRAFMAGRMPIPSSGAFGPCFSRTMRAARRYEVGFDPAVLGETRRIVRGIVRGSAAEAAGLRNGDEILKPVPQDQIQADQKMILTLEIKRDSRTFQIAYLPRGELVDVYQWQRVDSVPDGACIR